MDMYTTTLGFFSEAGLVAIVLFLFFTFLVVVWWLGRAITRADQKRDEYNSKRDTDNANLVKSQIKIMQAQQSEFTKLNGVVIESLQEKNFLLAETTKTNKALAIVMNNLGKSISASQSESKKYFTNIEESLQPILEHLESERQYTLLMVGVIDKLAQNIANSDANSEKYCLECIQWKDALDARLENIETRIGLILEGIRNEESPNHSANAV